MAWIKLDTTTPDKSEIIALATALKCKKETAFMYCIELWRWADGHIADDVSGNTGLTFAELDGAIFHKRGVASALKIVGWLNENADGKAVIPRFDWHNGNTAKQRLRKARNSKNYRDRKAGGGADEVGENVTVLSPFNLSLEKSQRREEKKDIDGAGESVSQSPPYEAEPPQTVADTPTLAEIIEVMRGAGLPEGEAEKCARKFCEVNGDRWHALAAWARAARGYAERWRANLTAPGVSEASTGTRTPPDDDAFRAWYTPLMQAHPALRECASLPPNVEKAARAAYASLPNAAAHAPMLTAYFADRLQEDKHGKKFWRPDGGEQYFSNLADIIAHAYRWQKETGAGKKKRRDCNDPSRYRSSRMGCNDPNDYASPAEMGEVCSEEEKRAFFADMRRDLGMTAEPPPTPPPGYDDGVPF